MSGAPKRVIKCGKCLKVLTPIDGDPARIPVVVRTGLEDNPDLPVRGQTNQFGRVRYSEAHDSWRVTCSHRSCRQGWIFDRAEVEAAKGDELIAGHQIGRPVGT